MAVKDRVDRPAEFEALIQAAGPSDIYVGIDPGSKGAIGFLRDGKVAVLDIPTIQVPRTGKTAKGNDRLRTEFNDPAIIDLFDDVRRAGLRVRGVGLEIAQVMISSPFKGKGKPGGSSGSAPKKTGGNTVRTAYAVGAGYRMWHLYFRVLGWPLHCVHPSTWKAYFKLSKKGKAESIRLANEYHPELRLVLKGDDNRAEAALLARYVASKAVDAPQRPEEPEEDEEAE